MTEDLIFLMLLFGVKMKTIKYQIRYALPIWAIQLLCCWLPDNKISIKIRGFLIAFFLPGKPQKLTIGRDVTLLGINNLFIKDNVYIAKGSWINALAGVHIGNNVLISPYVIIASLTHSFNGDSYLGASKFKSIHINDGCWVASHSTIAAGVNLEKCSLIASNSTVIRDTVAFGIYSGVPAEKVASREQQ